MQRPHVRGAHTSRACEASGADTSGCRASQARGAARNVVYGASHGAASSGDEVSAIRVVDIGLLA